MYRDLLKDYNELMKKTVKEHRTDSDKSMLNSLGEASIVSILFSVAGLICQILGNQPIIGLLIVLVGFILLLLCINSIEKKSYVKQIREQLREKEQTELRKLLSDYKIDYEKKEETDALIQLFKEQKHKDNWLMILAPAGVTFAALCLFTAKECVSKIVQSGNWNTGTFWSTVIVILIAEAGAILYSGLKSILEDLLPGKQYDHMVRDLRQVYLFRDKFKDTGEKADRMLR